MLPATAIAVNVPCACRFATQLLPNEARLAASAMQFMQWSVP
ncbi:MAG: hypothetical protein ACREPR_01360 [Brasilonema sp.]